MRIGLLIAILLYISTAVGQSRYTMQVIPVDKTADFFQGKFSFPKHYKDSAQANKQAVVLLNKLHMGGYLGSSIDSMQVDTLSTSLYIYVGDKFERVVLQNGNVDEGTLAGAGVRNAVNRERAVDIKTVNNIREKILKQCENTGYPFATVWLDSFARTGGDYVAKIYLEKNDLIRIDTIRILGQTKVKRVFLKNYLGIKTGRAYNESNVKNISNRLKELQFAEPLQPHNVEFQNGKAAINVFLKDRKASLFNLLIGLLPGSSGKKVLITGDAKIHLFSPFGLGEELYLAWQSLQPKTQQLNVRVSYPYLLGLPLGISARFELYKRDTSYIDLDGDYGIQYQIIGSNYLKASLRQKNTIILNVDTAYIKNTRRLPNNLDVNSNEFALEYYLQHLDYRFNPTDGYVLTLGGSAGVKRIRKNNTIASLVDELTDSTFARLYDTVRLKSFQFRLNLAIEKYWKLAPRHTIKTNASGGYFFSRNIFDNEKYRLGGVNSLRGFDDQSIFTPYYAMGNVEYRFLISKNSYFSAFFNAAMVEDARPGKTFDFPYGFGAGAAVETKAGIFGITYAMGTQLGNKLNGKSAKIHFGYVNYF